MGTPYSYRCECGDATGVRCEEIILRRETAIVVEWMPEWIRASHEAAGNSGQWPANGSLRLRVTPRCAEMLTESDPDWSRVVEVRS